MFVSINLPDVSSIVLFSSEPLCRICSTYIVILVGPGLGSLMFHFSFADVLPISAWSSIYGLVGAENGIREV